MSGREPVDKAVVTAKSTFTVTFGTKPSGLSDVSCMRATRVPIIRIIRRSPFSLGLQGFGSQVAQIRFGISPEEIA